MKGGGAHSHDPEAFHEHGGKLPRSTAQRLCHGTLLVLDARGQQGQVAAKAIEFMKDRMGGPQFRNFHLVGGGRNARPANGTGESIDNGYDFIERECPMEGTQIAQLRWVSKQVADPGSPIFNWSKGEVKEAVAALKSAAATASTQYYIPITLLDCTPEVRTILKFFLKTI